MRWQSSHRRPRTSRWDSSSTTAEWRGHGVDVLGLVLGATDTPSFHRVQKEHPWPVDSLADPDHVARTALDHLRDGPTWIWGSDDPTGGSPFGSLSRREAVLAMSGGGEMNSKSVEERS
jgi:uncharacterized protein